MRVLQDMNKISATDVGKSLDIATLKSKDKCEQCDLGHEHLNQHLHGIIEKVGERRGKCQTQQRHTN